MEKEKEKKKFESNFKVIQGNFGEGDPEVIESYRRALKQIEEITGGKIKAYAMVCIHGDRCIGTVYESGVEFSALIGGLESLKYRMLSEAEFEFDE